MSPLDLDEQTLSNAFHQIDLEPLRDSDWLARTAAARGRRTRRARGAVTGAVVAVLVGSGGAALLHQQTQDHASAPPVATQPGHQHSKGAKPGTHRAKRHQASAGQASLDNAYAVLDADGWTAPSGQPFQTDDKLYYESGHQGVSLNWRPAGDAADPEKFGQVVGSATIDGDPAQIRSDLDTLTVVGPVKDGRMLTLSGPEVIGLDALRSLAAHVHRQ